MSKTLAYLRASPDKQDLKNQKLEIFEYARKNHYLTQALEWLGIHDEETAKSFSVI